MPIKVTCQCGQSFAAKDELAGKTVKCPKCTKPLRIPEAGPRVAAPAAPRPAAAAATAPQRAAPQPGLGGPLPSAASAASLFDEAGIGQAAAGTLPCPGCGAALPPNVILCVKCGYNKRMGRRMETIRGSGTPLGGGHEATAEEMLERAARSIEEEKEEERKKTKEGVPWYVYLIGLGCALGFIVVMMLIPPEKGMMFGGGLLALIGVVLALYSYISVVVISFKENIGMGLMTLLLGGCGFLIYCIMRWDRCGGYFLTWLGGQAVQFAGGAIIAFAPMLAEDDDEAAVDPPEPRPAAVAMAEPSWHGERLLQHAG